MRYIYSILSPSGKRYVGKSKISIESKIKSYKRIEKYDKSNRKIVNAIRKYGWENMVFEVIEHNGLWTDEDLNVREIFWIQHYDSVNTGYNLTKGGEGVDSEFARQHLLHYYATMTEEKRAQRSKNCSKGQRKRFRETPESESTKQKKSQAHRGQYRIESPDGKVWITDLGLKEFAKIHENELTVRYWQLFAAYRKCYTNTQTTATRKNINHWKVTRIDKPNI
jgi:group I intron endonuclease